MLNRLIFKFTKIIFDSSMICHNGKMLNKILDDINIYSNEEKIIGVWINKKRIYRKVITLSSISGNISISDLQIDDLVKFECLFKVALPNSQIQWRTIPWTYATSSGYGSADYLGGVTLSVDQSELQFQCGKGFTNNFEKGYVILEYTKSTD